MRKAASEKLSTSSVKEFYETQMKESVVLVHDLLDEPARWDRHFRRTAASSTLSIVYGHPTLTSEQDHIVEVINDFADRIFQAVATGAHLVEFFPWLRHLPSRWAPSLQHNRLTLKL
jgi:hypothetical protein